MSFDPVDFLKISNELLTGNTAAHYRSLINRAYYAAFGHVRNNLYISTTGGSMHQEVIKHYPRVFAPILANHLDTRAVGLLSNELPLWVADIWSELLTYQDQSIPLSVP